MYVLIPQGVAMTAAVLAWALSRLEQGHNVVMASVISTSGSVPGKVGARLALSGSGQEEQWVGTVGGAGLEMKVLQHCRTVIKGATKASGDVLTYGLNKGAKGYQVTPLDSLCGGQVTLAVEVIIAMPHILLMGAGHCAKALVKGIQSLDWSYSIHDTRAEFVTFEDFPDAKELHCNSVKSFFEGDENNAVIATSADTKSAGASPAGITSAIMSTGAMNGETRQSLCRFSDILLLGHDWSEDQQRLLSLLTTLYTQDEMSNAETAEPTKPRIGVIGSRSKWQAFEKECLKVGIEQHSLDQIQCPIGINIGAETPEEIAVAVIAQILSAHKGVDHLEPTWRQSRT